MCFDTIDDTFRTPFALEIFALGIYNVETFGIVIFEPTFNELVTVSTVYTELVYMAGKFPVI